MDGELYSVKDVAALIGATKGESQARIMRQVRHWTQHDLLHPVTGKSTGTGTSRLYDAHAVRCAVILHEFARYGIPLINLDGFDEWTDAVSQDPRWKAAITGKREVFITMAWVADGGSAWGFAADEPTLTAFRSDQGFSSAIVINLTRLFSRLDL